MYASLLAARKRRSQSLSRGCSEAARPLLDPLSLSYDTALGYSLMVAPMAPIQRWAEHIRRGGAADADWMMSCAARQKMSPDDFSGERCARDYGSCGHFCYLLYSH